MRGLPALGAVSATLALLVAGCGSSAKSTTTNTTGGGSSSSSAASGSGPYGETSSSASGAPNTSSTAGASSTGSTAGGAGVVIVSKHSHDGAILAAGPKRMTVYLFEGDHGSSSACTGACAQAWPPVTTAGAASAGTGATAADLGTIARADGTTQVTYRGHPLYFYVKDKDNGDAYGQGVNAFGAGWYVLKPSGAKVDNS